MALWAFRAARLAYGDAEAHLNIGRRLTDSLTPGYEQIGTVWLPLPHALMAIGARSDDLWHSGLAGAAVAAIAFALAAVFLFASARSTLQSVEAGVAATLIFALNPNLLFLASSPMTETLSLACQLGLIAGLVRYARTESRVALIGAAIAACCGTLVRYDGWFLLPFAALVVLLTAGSRRWPDVVLFCFVAGLGPVYWLAHNRFFFSNWLEFYNGPYSAIAIQGAKPYPGRGDWLTALRYYAKAGELVSGLPVILLGAIGLVGVAIRMAWTPLLLLAAVPLFYISSLHSGGTPIFVPGLWPNSHYNSRYGVAVLPLAAFCLAALVAMTPEKWRKAAVVIAVGVAVSPWVFYPRSESWVVYHEARINSKDRRGWTAEASAYLRREYRHGDRVFASFGDLTGILREAHIPLRETFHEGNGLVFDAAIQRPDLFLWPRWIIAFQGDRVSRMAKRTPGAELVQVIRSGNATPVEIWRRKAIVK